MHEMSIAESIVNIVKNVMQDNQGKSLREVVVEVGELMAVVPDSLSFCYEAIVEGTDLAGSRLTINTIPIRVICNDCKQEFKIEEFSFLCPACNSGNLTEVSGREMNISHLEVD